MTHPELDAEQAHVDKAYERLETLRSEAVKSSEHMASRGAATTEGLWERDALFSQRRARVVSLTIGDDEPLVFGRIDTAAIERFHVGRVGVLDNDKSSLVVDWRAPAAEAFYRATPGDTQGVVRRRHIHCRGPRVVSLDDELLDTSDPAAAGLTLVGEAALLRAVERERSGRMRDIVATIQIEQDRIIRAPMEGIFVVQGGPGTGKTAVALHRAAYLLYTHRARLERSGVLLVGPDPIFLRYVEQVLPSLGERSVVLATANELADGTTARGVDTPIAAAVKGDLRMVQVMRRAMRYHERGVKEPVRVLYDNEMLELTPSDTANISREVAKTRGTHNEQRRTLVMAVLHHLVDVYRRESRRSANAGRRGPAPWGSNVPKEERTEFFQAMLDEDRVVEAIDEMWPVMTPERLLRELYASPDALRFACDRHLEPQERDALARPADAAWAPADVALLDEARVLLGNQQRKKSKKSKIEEEELFGIERMLDYLQEHAPIIAMERGWLAERYKDDRAELDNPKAAPEVRKTFGHVVVDEAQDLSPMQWRMIGRRCPSKSMTIVGDLAQASGAWVPSGWDDVLDAVKPRRDPTVAELSINYRTPSQIMDVANRVIEGVAPGLKRAQSVRVGDGPPRFMHVGADQLVDTAVREAVAAADDIEGTVTVIAPRDLIEQVHAALGERAGGAPGDLDADVVVLDPRRAKGLEFDVVIVIEPAAIEREAGARGLYVVLTRPTQALTIVHTDELPVALQPA